MVVPPMLVIRRNGAVVAVVPLCVVGVWRD